MSLENKDAVGSLMMSMLLSDLIGFFPVSNYSFEL